MSAAAVIDSLEFARAEQQLRGSLEVAGLKRLEDVLYDTQGTLSYSLTGSRDERNRPLLELRIEGPLHLQCQRCLGLLDYAVEVANTLLVLPRGVQADEATQDPDAPDVIEPNPALDVAELVEDEVLLSLPLAPRHAEGVCESRLKSEQSAQAAGAFAQLAALRQPRNQR
jgi:uncharacterized protein